MNEEKEFRKLEKSHSELDSDDYRIKSDIGYKYFLNWLMKKLAESFMIEGNISRSSLCNIYSKLKIMVKFFPYMSEDIIEIELKVGDKTYKGI